MERSHPKLAYYPVRCPGCDGIVNLLVGNSLTITVQLHNVPDCNATFYYRCWLERGLRLPRVEFVAADNAMEMTLHPHGDTPVPSTASPPSTPPRSPHLDASVRARAPKGSARRADSTRPNSKSDVRRGERRR